MGCRPCDKEKRVTRAVSKNGRFILKISGMHCKHCVLAVRSIIEAIPDVKDIIVEEGLASFQADRNLNIEEVINAIELLGYNIESN
jgi:copper chaperone CopZ